MFAIILPTIPLIVVLCWVGKTILHYNVVSGGLIDENKHTRVRGDLTQIILPWDKPHHQIGGEGGRGKASK